MAAQQHGHTDDSWPDVDLAYHGLPATAARVFRLLPAHPGPDVSATAVSALADLSVSETRRALVLLTRANLIEAASGDAQRWRMDGMIRRHAQQVSAAHGDVDGREQAMDRLFDYYLSATEAADDWLRGVPPIPVPQEFSSRNGALAWLDAERASLIAATRMAADTGRDQAAKSLPLLMAHYLGFRGRFGDLLSVTTISLNAARRLGDRAAEGDALTNLGLALNGLQRYDEAATAHHEAAAIFRRTRDCHGEGSALNNLGIAFRGLRRDDEAATAHHEAAAIFRKIPDCHGEGSALNNLGLALRALRQFDEAVAAHREAAAIFRETGDRHSEAKALGNLGNVLQELGLSQGAVAAYQEAADIFRETGDQPSELRALESLDLAREAL